MAAIVLNSMLGLQCGEESRNALMAMFTVRI